MVYNLIFKNHNFKVKITESEKIENKNIEKWISNINYKHLLKKYIKIIFSNVKVYWLNKFRCQRLVFEEYWRPRARKRAWTVYQLKNGQKAFYNFVLKINRNKIGYPWFDKILKYRKNKILNISWSNTKMCKTSNK